MRLQICVLYNSGVEKVYRAKLTDKATEENIKELIEYYEERFIKPIYKEGIHGYFNFLTETDEDVIINLKQTSSVSFKIIDVSN